jgi:hypothetical protein
MNRNFQIRLLFSVLSFLLVFIILALPLISKCNEEKVKIGLYSFSRAPTPKYLVTGVNLPELSKARFRTMDRVDVGLKGRWGRSFTLFQKEEKKQVKITVAVYGSVAEAEDSVLDLLNDTSAVLKPGSKSGDVIGTHSWYLTSHSGSGTVVFTYDNSLFQLFASDYSLAERSAREIVNDLKLGRNGIKLGKLVALPKITDVKVPSELKTGKERTLIIKGRDPHQQKLSFVALASKGQLLETKKRGEKMYIPQKIGTDELRIYAINEMNVISQVYIKKIEIEK